MPPPLTSAPLLGPKDTFPVALHSRSVLFDMFTLLWTTKVLPMILNAEMRENPEDPTNKLIPPPLAVEPNVVAAAYTRAWQWRMTFPRIDMLLKDKIVSPITQPTELEDAVFKLRVLRPMLMLKAPTKRNVTRTKMREKHT